MKLKSSLGPLGSGILAAGILSSTTVFAEGEAASWTQAVSVAGDLRLRYEMIRQDQAENRDRGRFRGRIGISADVADDVRVVFGLATGGDDPVSTNQSFGEGFTTKDIGVDLAYVDWTINDSWALSAGKMVKPWFRAGGTTLVWDSDLNPEGLAIAYRSNTLFATAGSFVIAERSSAAESRLNTVQAGVNFAFSDDSKLTAALGYFDYTNVIGQSPFYNDDPQGNTVDGANNYVFDYNEVELGAQYVTKVGGWPLTVFGDYVVNTEVDRQDTAYSLGAVLGRIKAPGSMQFSYAWHDTGADAINATYNDSDFADGMTDARGHYIRARYALREKIILGGTFIFSEFGRFAGDPRDFNRVMLDVEFEF